MRRAYGSLLLVLVAVVPLCAYALDHDTDGKSDLTVFRPQSDVTPGYWFVSSSALNGTLAYQWGLAGDYPVQGFYTGVPTNRGADLGVWRPSNGVWYIRHHDANLQLASASAYQWGILGDSPQPCDFDGDGRAELAVFRPPTGEWFLRNSIGTQAYDNWTYQQWGLEGDVPIPADFDTDGKCDFTVYRQGNWYIIPSSLAGEAAATIAWGAAGDIPVPGHYDADNILDLAVYRENSPSGPIWLIRKSTLAGLTYRVVQWGLPGDLAVPGDYTGDGKTDIAVFRPSTGVWYILTSESSYHASQAAQFGLTGDIPTGDRRGADPAQN
jgi:hypothetical protein